MKARKNLMSALLGAALLAMPITAAAHPHDGEGVSEQVVVGTEL